MFARLHANSRYRCPRKLGHPSTSLARNVSVSNDMLVWNVIITYIINYIILNGSFNTILCQASMLTGSQEKKVIKFNRNHIRVWYHVPTLLAYKRIEGWTKQNDIHRLLSTVRVQIEGGFDYKFHILQGNTNAPQQLKFRLSYRALTPNKAPLIGKLEGTTLDITKDSLVILGGRAWKDTLYSIRRSYF